MDIIDGQKCIVCKLKDNPMGYTSIAYPTDELRIPDWFKELPFADDEMEAKLINKKLEVTEPIRVKRSSAPTQIRQSRAKDEESRDDSFFSKPYEAPGGISVPNTTTDKKTASTAINKSEKKKPIAALFMPPTGRKKS